ncbi:hypothetical protein CEB3_c01230 [Peptococcaceae bacterium CEB3]|nr:hypothetical protein CEB3_c01230 [Peptococcaceae bacterium CEB3]
MKKMFSLLCLALLFISIVGCSPSGAAEGKSGSSKSQEKGSMLYGPSVTIQQSNLDPNEVARQLFESYLKHRETQDFPVEGRIKGYRIDFIKTQNSNPTGLVFAVSYAVLPATTQYVLAGNGKKEKSGWISNIFNYVKVSRHGQVFRIAEIATSPIPS